MQEGSDGQEKPFKFCPMCCSRQPCRVFLLIKKPKHNPGLALLLSVKLYLQLHQEILVSNFVSCRSGEMRLSEITCGQACFLTLTSSRV